MTIPAQTTGVGTATKVNVDALTLTLSLGGTTTHQITASPVDVAGTAAPGTTFVLSAAGTASGGVTVYTGTITGGGSSAFAGETFVVAGFATSANNGTFECSASSATTLTLGNAAGAAETHAGTAVSEGLLKVTYWSQNPSVATVSASGVVTAVAVGNTVIAASYPTFGNTLGNIVNSGNPMNGLPLEKIYTEINVAVTL